MRCRRSCGHGSHRIRHSGVSGPVSHKARGSQPRQACAWQARQSAESTLAADHSSVMPRAIDKLRTQVHTYVRSCVAVAHCQSERRRYNAQPMIWTLCWMALLCVCPCVFVVCCVLACACCVWYAVCARWGRCNLGRVVEVAWNHGCLAQPSYTYVWLGVGGIMFVFALRWIASCGVRELHRGEGGRCCGHCGGAGYVRT